MEPKEAHGQAANPDAAGTTGAAPKGEAGQSVSPDQTTGKGPDSAGTQVESTFFDPKSIEHSPELQTAYRQMQSQWTKGMNTVREGKQKIQAYDQFMQDPAATVRQLASQYGMTVVEGQPDAKGNEEFSPQTWTDVVDHISQQVRSELENQYAPLVNEVTNLKKQNVEQYLDTNFSDWRQYEDEMVGLLTQHPTLAQDPSRLYHMAVPADVLEARATERALKRLREGANAGAAPGVKGAAQVTSDKPKGKMTVNEAAEFARAQLRKQGISKPLAG